MIKLNCRMLSGDNSEGYRSARWVKNAFDIDILEASDGTLTFSSTDLDISFFNQELHAYQEIPVAQCFVKNTVVRYQNHEKSILFRFGDKDLKISIKKDRNHFLYEIRPY